METRYLIYILFIKQLHFIKRLEIFDFRFIQDFYPFIFYGFV